jgi:hypothetical protein
VKPAENIQQYLRNNIHTAHGEQLLYSVAIIQAEYHKLRDKRFQLSVTASPAEMDRFLMMNWCP